MGIYKNEKNKTWYFRTHYKSLNGEYKYVTRRGFKTKGEAKKAEAEFIANKQESIVDSDNKSTLELYEEYYNYKKHIVKESTLLTDDVKVQHHILPYFKNKRIVDITIKDIDEWHHVLLSNNKNYSIQYINALHTIFSMIMKYAIRRGYIKYNVLEQCGRVPVNSNASKEMKFYTFEEWLEFENALEDNAYKILFQFLYFTGARIGEALALQFKDFDQDFKNVYINKTITNKTKEKGIKITKTKNSSSIRTISIPDKLSLILKQYYEECQGISGFNKNCYVFGIAKPFSTTQVERKKNNAIKRCKLKKIRIHDFRHSHASFLINNGVPPIYISKRLGHKSLETTLNTYVHMFDNQNQIAIDIINNKLNEI